MSSARHENPDIVTLVVTPNATGTEPLIYAGVQIFLIKSSDTTYSHYLVMKLPHGTRTSASPFPTISLDDTTGAIAIVHELPILFDFHSCEAHLACHWHAPTANGTTYHFSMIFSNMEALMTLLGAIAVANNFDVKKAGTGVLAVTHTAVFFGEVVGQPRTAEYEREHTV